MRRPLALLLAVALPLLAACSGRIDPQAAHDFEKANALFLKAKDKRDFLKAAALYRSVLDRGVRSGALFYDLGNAYARAGRTGHAVAAYRQAERYRPDDPYLEANLKQTLPEHESAARPLLAHLLFWQDWVSYPDKFLLLAAAGSLAFLAALFALLLPGKRSLFRNTAFVFLAATLLLAISAGVQYHDVAFVRHGAVTQESVVARKGNAKAYEPALTKPLPRGTEFTVEERRGDWLHIRLPQNLEGWIPAASATTW